MVSVNFKEKHKMLWYKLLQNTTCCGKLKFTAYQLYWRGLEGERRKLTDRRLKIKSVPALRKKSLFFNLRLLLTIVSCKRFTAREEEKGGLLWIAPLSP